MNRFQLCTYNKCCCSEEEKKIAFLADGKEIYGVDGWTGNFYAH